nr:sigma-70 family RNA polymerase sigma factor [uncultured Allomuricauda sp.]
METTQVLHIESFSLRTEEDFRKLYDAHWEEVCSICLRLTGDTSLSEDLTQDIFVSIWERKEKLRLRESIGAYLAKSAKLKVFEHYRNLSIKTKNLNEIQRKTNNSVQDTDLPLVQSLLLKQIQKVVQSFPQQRRVIFDMSRNHGMNNQEISEVLNLSPRNVRYHLKKAVLKIKSELHRLSVIIIFFFFS